MKTVEVMVAEYLQAVYWNGTKAHLYMIRVAKIFSHL